MVSSYFSEDVIVKSHPIWIGLNNNNRPSAVAVVAGVVVVPGDHEKLSELSCDGCGGHKTGFCVALSRIPMKCAFSLYDALRFPGFSIVLKNSD